jgi:hypothetical protein
LPQIKTSLLLLRDCLTLWTPFCHKKYLPTRLRKKVEKKIYNYSSIFPCCRIKAPRKKKQHK